MGGGGDVAKVNGEGGEAGSGQAGGPRGLGWVAAWAERRRHWLLMSHYPPADGFPTWVLWVVSVWSLFGVAWTMSDGFGPAYRVGAVAVMGVVYCTPCGLVLDARLKRHRVAGAACWFAFATYLVSAAWDWPFVTCVAVAAPSCALLFGLNAALVRRRGKRRDRSSTTGLSRPST